MHIVSGALACSRAGLWRSPRTLGAATVWARLWHRTSSAASRAAHRACPYQKGPTSMRGERQQGLHEQRGAARQAGRDGRARGRCLQLPSCIPQGQSCRRSLAGLRVCEVVPKQGGPRDGPPRIALLYPLRGALCGPEAPLLGSRIGKIC